MRALENITYREKLNELRLFNLQRRMSRRNNSLRMCKDVAAKSK